MPTVLNFNRLKETVLPEWTKPENASVFDPAYRAPIRTIIKWLGLDDPQQVMAFGTPLETGPMAGGAIEAIGKRFPRFAEALKVYHGSPHDFEKFDASKIGTGEGAQAYGHGLYFAENEATAKSYRDVLQQPLVEVGGHNLPVPNWSADLSPMDRVVRRISDLRAKNPSASDSELLGKVRSSIREEAAGPYANVDSLSRQGSILDEFEKQGVKSTGGKMYEVAIHADPEHFLDWDKPLSQQSEHVKQALDRLGVKVKPVVPWEPHEVTVADIQAKLVPSNYAPGSWISVQKDPAGNVEWHGGQLFGSRSAAAQSAEARTAIDTRAARDKGSEIYHDLVSNKPEASKKLKDAGISGIRYFDQGSRSAKEGTRNYVVFPGNEHLIDILKKYGITATTGVGVAGGLASQEGR